MGIREWYPRILGTLQTPVFPVFLPIRLPFSLDPCFSWVTTTFFSVDLSGPPTSRPAGLQLFSQLGYRHPPDSRFPIDSPIRLPFSLDPYFSWVTTFCSAGLQLFAQHTERLSCAFPSEWFQHLSCDFPPFCLIWVATWISSYTGLPSSSYYFPSELWLPIKLLNCDPVCDPVWVVPSHHSARPGLPPELVPSLGCRLAVTHPVCHPRPIF